MEDLSIFLLRIEDLLSVFSRSVVKELEGTEGNGLLLIPVLRYLSKNVVNRKKQTL